MNSQETLRPKFFAARQFASILIDPWLIYAAGFYSGQMEKVLVGACRYCMFRPDPSEYKDVLDVVQKLVSIYGLIINHLNDEIWISHGDDKEFNELKSLKKNTPEYHKLRGRMCGIKDIDPNYHLREGHASESTSGIIR